MRVRFFSPEDEAEAARYSKTLAAIDAFWRSFEAVARRPAVHWLLDLRAQLGRVHPDLGLELAEARDGTRTLYVVPLDGALELPLAELCVERAPRRLPWCFEVERPPNPLRAALEASRSDSGIDLSSARARVGVSRGHLLEVVIASPEFSGAADPSGLDAAEHFVARLVGDRAYSDWIGDVSIQSAPRRSSLRLVGPGSLPDLPLAIDELCDAVEAAGRGIRSGLADVPHHANCEHAEWVMFELSELGRVEDSARPSEWGTSSTRLADSPAQSDLRVATTSCPEALKCFLSGAPFSSRRFSRHGERFCYLKLRLAGSDEARASARSDLEEELNRALVPGRLGCVVGAGLGSEFVYIDLALSKVDAVIELLRRRIQRHGVERDAWLLFFDDEWREEWVSLGRDPVPPPGR